MVRLKNDLPRLLLVNRFQFEAPPIRRILHGCVSGLDSLCLAATFRFIQLVATDVTCVGQCGDPYSLDSAAGLDGERANGK